MIEKVVFQLSSKGLAVGTIKHIRDGDFSIDVKGKDTWRHAQAGAKIVVGAAAKQVVILKKQTSPYQNVEEILNLIGNEKLDVIIIEGFRSLIAKRRDVFKVVLAKSKEDVEDSFHELTEPIVAIVGPGILRNAVLNEKSASFFDIDTEKEEAVQLIMRIVVNAQKHGIVKRKRANFA